MRGQLKDKQDKESLYEMRIAALQKEIALFQMHMPREIAMASPLGQRPPSTRLCAVGSEPFLLSRAASAGARVVGASGPYLQTMTSTPTVPQGGGPVSYSAPRVIEVDYAPQPQPFVG